MKFGDLARLLKASGSQFGGEDQLRADVAKGAPLNPDGSVNIVLFAAWLVREGER